MQVTISECIDKSRVELFDMFFLMEYTIKCNFNTYKCQGSNFTEHWVLSPTTDKDKVGPFRSAETDMGKSDLIQQLIINVLKCND